MKRPRKSKELRQFERTLEERTKRIEHLYARYAKEDGYDANAYAFLHMMLLWRRLMLMHRRATRRNALFFYLYLVLVGPLAIFTPSAPLTVSFTIFSLWFFYQYQHHREDEKHSRAHIPTFELCETTEEATRHLSKQLDKRYLEVYGER